MARQSGAVSAVGLDVGGRRARAVHLTRSGGGELLLHKAAVLELPPGGATDAALRALWGKLALRSASACCNLGPASVIVQQIEFPDMAEADLIAAARTEAEMLIPEIQAMILDYQVIGRKVKSVEDTAQMVAVMVVAAPRAAVTERTQLLARAGIRVHSMVPDGLALSNAVLALQPLTEGAVIALDIGAEGTGLVAVTSEKEVMAPVVRFIPGGVKLLAAVTGAERPETEGDRDQDSKRERWLREVERSLEFVSAKRGVPAQRLLIVGEGARSAEILQWLGQNVQIPVAAWNPLQQLKRGAGAPDQHFIQQWGPDCAVAVGLALAEGD